MPITTNSHQTLRTFGWKALGLLLGNVPLANLRAKQTIVIVFEIRLQLARAQSTFPSPASNTARVGKENKIRVFSGLF